MNRSASSRAWLWVGIGCGGLLIIGVVVLGAVVANFLRNPEVRSFVSDLSEMEAAERLAPVVTEAMKKYKAQNDAFPENLDALVPYLSPEAMKAARTAFTYAPSQPDASDEQPILVSRKFKMPGGGETQIVIQKDLKAYSLTKAPLEPHFSR